MNRLEVKMLESKNGGMVNTPYVTGLPINNCKNYFDHETFTIKIIDHVYLWNLSIFACSCVSATG